jgi:hypothetical protein
MSIGLKNISILKIEEEVRKSNIINNPDFLPLITKIYYICRSIIITKHLTIK